MVMMNIMSSHTQDDYNEYTLTMIMRERIVKNRMSSIF